MILLLSPSIHNVLALHWSGNGSFSPFNVYQGVQTQFTFHIVNQASGSLDVYWVFVHFCWNANGVGYYFKPNDGTSVTITGGGSHDFPANILVDQTTTGNCAVTVSVNGQAVGDLYKETATYNELINVLQVPPLQLSITANPSTGEAPLNVQFSSYVSGGIAPYSYAWSFGDGATDTSSAPQHPYQNAGSYTATLVVSDSQGTQKSTTTMVTVIPALTATISADHATGDVPLTVAFSATASGGTQPYSFSWTFGDDHTSTEQNPAHTFQVEGTYTVYLTVSDAAGGSLTKMLQITVKSSLINGSGVGLPPWTLYVTGSAILLVAVIVYFARHRITRMTV